VQFGGHLADIPAERLRSIVDDVVHLSAAALFDRGRRRLRDIVDVDPGHDPWTCHRGQRAEPGEVDEQLIVRHVRTIENAVAQHDSLGVAART
jgi:hypothetical protein